MKIFKLGKFTAIAAAALSVGLTAGCSNFSSGGDYFATGGATEEQGGRQSSYRVVSGDNLWDISSKSSVYGNPFQWPLIYKTNSAKIQDADLIYPGQRFAINYNVSASEAGQAVHHAKTRGSWSIGSVESSDRSYLD